MKAVMIIVSLIVLQSAGLFGQQSDTQQYQVVTEVTGSAPAVRLEWPQSALLMYEQGDPMFGIVCFKTYDLLSKTEKRVDAVDALVRYAADAKTHIRLDAKYGFGWDENGKRRDTSSFELVLRFGEAEEGKRVKLTSEPACIDLSHCGLYYAFCANGEGYVESVDAKFKKTIPDAARLRFGREWGTVYVLNSKKSTIRRIRLSNMEENVVAKASISSFDITPSETCLVYQTSESKGNALWAVNLAKAETTPLFVSATGYKCPAFSPDGKWLAFVRDDGKKATICRVEVATMLPTANSGTVSPGDKK